ncbi:membrane protein [Halolactibacillus alkaliphilus]|uniref:Membrane protein n=1 Tax=Halolactibacillus alkaliphilus TaxID=442899 RepID=A0A511X098_9BACI|nr:DUF2871 family protein [Halolactibacillus alkaliphilus]GEN56373.1 membrane protein [Halolactibacillus alkaliphilus]GGN67470.1 membrane protein [Halolactibacillus alkaliphilus]SFO92011.1 Protein of unknown function [Halolactibacillus alkaliphilus]
MKHYLNSAIVYTILGLTSGVFYREFTKFSGYSESTRLSLIHGHYISLGLFFFLFLLILEKQFAWSRFPKTKLIVLGYHLGLNISVLGFLIRGTSEVLGTNMTSALNASIAGISGIGHIILAVTLIMILFRVKKAI